MRATLENKLDNLPTDPGVYAFKDVTGRVLYVGKAKNLRKRVHSYFREKNPAAAKTRAMVARTADVEVIVTATEKEAVILEGNLIKKHRPRYNVVLRDDKNYLALRLDPAEDYPRLSLVRRFRKDGAIYFGPFASAQAVRGTLKVLNRVFPLRQCSDRKFRHRKRPCLNYQMGRCLGVCSGTVPREDYARVVEQAVLFLKGRTRSLQRSLREEMENAAAALEFEKAAMYRDRLDAVARTLERQHVAFPQFRDQDVIGVSGDAERLALAVLFVRGGRVVGSRAFDFEHPQGGQSEAVRAFILQYYGQGAALPEEILIGEDLKEQELLAEWLSELKGKRLNLRVPRRGDGRHLLVMAEHNAAARLLGRRSEAAEVGRALGELQRFLRLDSIPRRIECVDISNIRGRFAVGSLVVFQDGRPERSAYRRYRIRDVARASDTEMMAEVLRRRFSETGDAPVVPDLLVVDGGKGQLNQALAVLRVLGLDGQVHAVGLAKPPRDGKRRGKNAAERLYLPGRKNPLPLLPAKDPAVALLLARLRDEAHRFAIGYYQKRHRKEALRSRLDEVSGVGPKRRQALIRHFGSLTEVAAASVDELSRVPTVSRRLAERIHRALAGEGSGAP
jgi:excinuclease ABC subunit C